MQIITLIDFANIISSLSLICGQNNFFFIVFLLFVQSTLSTWLTALETLLSFKLTFISFKFKPVLEYFAPVFHHALPAYLIEDIARKNSEKSAFHNFTCHVISGMP